MKNFSEFNWKTVGNDFNSPFIRNYIWTKGLQRYEEILGVTSPVLGIASKENAIDYIGDMDTWAHTHELLKQKVVEDPSYIEKLIDTTNSFGEEFNMWSQKEIFEKELSTLNNKQLSELLNEFSDKQSILYTYGAALPILDFAGFAFVESNLKKILETKASEDAYQEYYAIFTEPSHNSFAQDQEEDLLNLISQFYDNSQWRQDILEKQISYFETQYPDFYEKLKIHTQKHCWVYYVYAGPAFTEKDFLGFIKDYIQKDIDPKEKLSSLHKRKEEIYNRKEELIKEFNANDFEAMILRLTGKLVWAKPRRKDYQSKSYYHLEKLLREIAKRLFISLSQARSINPEKLLDFLENNSAPTDELNVIYKLHICLPEEGRVSVVTGASALEIYDSLHQNSSEDFSNIQEVTGNVAFKGKATGAIKIVNTPDDMEKMQQGDILLSLATTPSIVPAMKKAAAIITDEGGLTCHASIVSRELQITCIVGTKIATKVFKDGDIVEVDANTGIVRKIS